MDFGEALPIFKVEVGIFASILLVKLDARLILQNVYFDTFIAQQFFSSTGTCHFSHNNSVTGAWRAMLRTRRRG